MRSDDEQAEVDAMRHAHRVASDRVDDRPDPGVRAAVLAAAARAVDARPHLASTETPSKTTFHAPLQSRRWPLSAAALLVVSVLTGLIATHVMRDSPERITTIASSTTAPQPSQTVVPTRTEAASPAASPTPVQEQRPAPAAESPRPKSGYRESAKRDYSTNRSIEATPVTPRRPLDERPAPPQAPAATVSVEPPIIPAPSRLSGDIRALAAPSSARSKAQGAAPSTDAQDAAAPTSAPRGRAEAFVRATNAQDTARTRVGRIAEPATPEAWVERIARLRADGNDVEADRELDALRQRYPGFEIPAAVLKTTGTR